jgi:hypothetical protein
MVAPRFRFDSGYTQGAALNPARPCRPRLEQRRASREYRGACQRVRRGRRAGHRVRGGVSAPYGVSSGYVTRYVTQVKNDVTRVVVALLGLECALLISFLTEHRCGSAAPVISPN